VLVPVNSVEAARVCFSGEPSLGSEELFVKKGDSEKASLSDARVALALEPVMSARMPVLVAALAREGPGVARQY
jgi:hypothetical protein